MLIIRLQRTGKRNSPQYRVVLAQKTAANQKQVVEVLGSYNPHTKNLGIKDNDRLNYWIKEQHVELSPTVHNLFITKELVTGTKLHSFTIPKKAVEAPETQPAEATPAEVGTGQVEPDAPKISDAVVENNATEKVDTAEAKTEAVEQAVSAEPQTVEQSVEVTAEQAEPAEAMTEQAEPVVNAKATTESIEPMTEAVAVKVAGQTEPTAPPTVEHSAEKVEQAEQVVAEVSPTAGASEAQENTTDSKS